MYRRTLAVLALALAALGALVARADTAAADHAWGPYHWARTANPFTLALGDNVSAAWDAALRTASADWSQSTVLDTTVVAGGTEAQACRPTLGRVEVCSGNYGQNQHWIGLARIWIQADGHIVQGAVLLNDAYFDLPRYNTTAWRNLVTCQEIGHTFGLDHQDENFNNANLGTCMDYTRDPSTNQHPNQGDYDQLLCIYDPAYNGKTLRTRTHSCTGTGHLDSTTTVGAAAAGAAPADAPGDWGEPVGRTDSLGRQILFVKDLGAGQRVFTWVFWALP